MAKKNGSTAQSSRGLPSKDVEGFARLEYFYSLPPAEKESYLEECDPVIALALREWLISKETGIGELGKIKALPARPNSVRRELILLDFKEYALIEALNMLREMAVAGEINGLIFAAKYTKPGIQRHFFGAEGRYQGNIDEALGVATQLQMDLARQAAK